jgi:hypothetical protein
MLKLKDYIEEFYEKIALDAFDDGDACGTCKYYRITKDVYGTGDSPTVQGCEVYEFKDCPVVRDVVKLIGREDV